MWNRDNREKVERDEANARAEEVEKRHRADMADQVGAGDFFLCRHTRLLYILPL